MAVDMLNKHMCNIFRGGSPSARNADGSLAESVTITSAASYPFLSTEKEQKSMEICCQGRSAMGKGWRSPGA